MFGHSPNNLHTKLTRPMDAATIITTASAATPLRPHTRSELRSQEESPHKNQLSNERYQKQKPTASTRNRSESLETIPRTTFSRSKVMSNNGRTGRSQPSQPLPACHCPLPPLTFPFPLRLARSIFLFILFALRVVFAAGQKLSPLIRLERQKFRRCLSLLGPQLARGGGGGIFGASFL